MKITQRYSLNPGEDTNFKPQIKENTLSNESILSKKMVPMRSLSSLNSLL